jgi:hypothetical protein
VAERWTYLFCDLLTDQPLGILDVEGATFSSLIVVPGTFSGQIPITNAEDAALARQVFPHPDLYPPPAGEGRVVCHVYVGEDMTNIWDSYLIWECDVQGGEDARMSIRGATLDSYLHHREIWDDLAMDQEDQIDVAHALVADAAFEAGGDIGFGITGDLSGVLVDFECPASQAATYGQRLTQLANVENGFEFRARSYVDMPAGNRVREFTTGYPGLAGDGTEMVAVYPGNIVNYSYKGNATDAATRWRGRGDTVNDDLTATSEPLVGNIVGANDFLGAGWPYLDRTVDYQGIKTVDELDAFARWWRDTRSGVQRVPEMTIVFDEDHPLHPRMLGGYCQVAIEDLLFPLNDDGTASFRHRWRVVGMEVTPHAGDVGVDVARVVLEEGLRAA